jgi:class 3 adenylate cyclase
VLNDSVPDMVLFGAVLLLGEAVRNRRALDPEREKSERLLLNVLPASIATRLKQTEAVIADRFPEVTVLFADIVDFTRRSERITPEQVVEVLNDLFSVFDQFARQRGLEKIKTIGTPTWSLEACPTRALTTPMRWPRWPWRCARRWPGALTRAASRWPSGSASTRDRSWPA